ncbi:unnamed protein product, partial [Larinioides sclopetarius]
QYRNGTGGGPPPKDLADLDLRILALIGQDGYAGLKVMETAPKFILPSSYDDSPACSTSFSVPDIQNSIVEIQGEKDPTCLVVNLVSFVF